MTVRLRPRLAPLVRPVKMETSAAFRGRKLDRRVWIAVRSILLIVHQMLLQETIGEARRATEELLLLFKRVSLDEDLEDSLRGEMMTTITEGTSDMMDILRLVQVQDKRSQSEIAAAFHGKRGR